MDQSSNQSDNGANSRGDSRKARAPVVPEPGDSGSGSATAVVLETAPDQKAKTGGSSQVLEKDPAPEMVTRPPLDRRTSTMKRNGGKTYEELMEEIERMELFHKLTAGSPGISFLEFYDGLSRIFEKLSVKRGGSHISLPEKEAIENEFNRCGGNKGYLEKEEFRDFLKKILSRGIGLRNYEMAMYLAGVPVISVIVKPFIPGTISEIPNSFFIPLVTSATAFVLAHMRKI